MSEIKIDKRDLFMAKKRMETISAMQDIENNVPEIINKNGEFKEYKMELIDSVLEFLESNLYRSGFKKPKHEIICEEP